MEMAVVDDPTVRNVLVAQDSKLRRATSPSPRLRGEGRGEGQSPRSKLGKPGMRGGFKKGR
jgi:hypothetical protein